MIDFSRALVKHLRSDSILSDKLGEFRGHPAIFATAPVPEPTTSPFIITRPVSDTTIHSKNSFIREVTQDIGIYDGQEDGSAADVELIAEYIREKLRAPFDVPDWSMSALETSGPIANNTSELHGRILTTRVVLDR